jgi:hypothetical protein
MAQDAIYMTSEDLSKLYKATRDVDKDMVKHLRKRILAASAPILSEVKSAALKIPSKGGETETSGRGQTQLGLRQGIASAAEVKINPNRQGSFSVRIRISGTKFRSKTGKYGSLPRKMEGLSRKPWRHPVFPEQGSTGGTWQGSWAVQEKHPYLLPTVLGRKKEVRESVIKAFIDTLDDMEIIL